MSIPCEIVLRWMSQGLNDDLSTLVQVIAWRLRKQTITWAIVGQVLYCHMALLDHHELTRRGLKKMACATVFILWEIGALTVSHLSKMLFIILSKFKRSYCDWQNIIYKKITLDGTLHFNCDASKICMLCILGKTFSVFPLHERYCTQLF